MEESKTYKVTSNITGQKNLAPEGSSYISVEI